MNKKKVVKKKTVKKKRTFKPVTIAGIEFGDYAHCLWSGACPEIKNQPGRFLPLEGKEKIKGGMFYFCDTYLEAKFFQAILKKRGVKTNLLSDEANSGSGGFVIHSSESCDF